MANNYKSFNWILAIVLNYVTCGIYSFVLCWIMSTNNNKQAEYYGVKKKMHFGVAVLLGFVTCGIVPLVWYFLFCAQQVELAKASGAKVTPTENGFLLGLLMFVPFYSFYVMCTNYNNTIAAGNEMAAGNVASYQ